MKIYQPALNCLSGPFFMRGGKSFLFSISCNTRPNFGTHLGNCSELSLASLSFHFASQSFYQRGDDFFSVCECMKSYAWAQSGVLWSLLGFWRPRPFRECAPLGLVSLCGLPSLQIRFQRTVTSKSPKIAAPTYNILHVVFRGRLVL